MTATGPVRYCPRPVPIDPVEPHVCTDFRYDFGSSSHIRLFDRRIDEVPLSGSAYYYIVEVSTYDCLKMQSIFCAVGVLEDGFRIMLDRAFGSVLVTFGDESIFLL